MKMHLRLSLLIILSLLGCQSESPPLLVDESEESAERTFSETSSKLQIDLEDASPEISVTRSSERKIKFVDVASEKRIDFTYDRFAGGNALMTEATGGGAGWIDFDLDGRIDLYFPQGGNPTASDLAEPDQLFRQLQDRNYTKIFIDEIGVKSNGYGQGITVGDFNSDGFDDIYITQTGSNRLLENLGDGTFLDITAETGLGGEYGWSSSAAWADLNQDGLLDLFLCNYLNFDPFTPVPCFDLEGKKATCHPHEIDALPNECFINQGDGGFLEQATQLGLRGNESKSLGVVIADLDGDRDPDIFVANDTTPNFLFMNQNGGDFDNEAIVRGVAMSGLGQNQASMGVALGDYNNDGWQDLYVTHFEDDSNTLYQNTGEGYFQDKTRQTDLHKPTSEYLGFGTVMADFNHDTQQELFVANGHIDDWRSKGSLWKMPAQLFTFDGQTWKELSETAGEYFNKEMLGRAVATADYDQDGDLDMMVVNQNDPCALLENRSETGNWLILKLVGHTSNRSAIGTHITVSQEERSQRHELPGGTSYCASHERIITVSLGKHDAPCRLEIHWPSGEQSLFKEIIPNQRIMIIEGYDAPLTLRSYQSHQSQ